MDKVEKSEKKESYSQFDNIDYKNVDFLQRFLSERGKILPRRLTMASAKQQRDLSAAVKRARFLALIAPIAQ